MSQITSSVCIRRVYGVWTDTTRRVGGDLVVTLLGQLGDEAKVFITGAVSGRCMDRRPSECSRTNLLQNFSLGSARCVSNRPPCIDELFTAKKSVVGNHRKEEEQKPEPKRSGRWNPLSANEPAWSFRWQ